ncbi:fluoride efflux transporter CrcB [Streptomyces somaliensis]|uniref:fluoride efflux transporter CrcB n=1 Tax=Streptomyces somaliensis TaxID=78355 RepID=UPI0020CCC86C|nr:fluoride efflux transporter CrcB [Streptomyces somaliensis]MCP9945382.1 fluoride efflux transporter CrcB [Streptomyces somaliensis]MCP9974221.1 fluoride efflux transporter CrcB [Streptomyces somaliensis]
MTWLLVLVGGALGAPLRYLADRAVRSRRDSAFPWGTLTVNVLGSLGLGVLAGAAVATPAHALLGTGLCGALTTYSTFSYETLRLSREGSLRYAAVNVAVTVTASLGAVAAGASLGGALGGA